jgi:hypothetical protein
MKYYYSTVKGVVLTHGDMQETPLGRNVRVYFERQNQNGFDFAEGSLPSVQFYKTFGFSEDELLRLKNYLRNNAPLIWEYAQKGGGEKCLRR